RGATGSSRPPRPGPGRAGARPRGPAARRRRPPRSREPPGAGAQGIGPAAVGAGSPGRRGRRRRSAVGGCIQPRPARPRHRRARRVLLGLALLGREAPAGLLARAGDIAPQDALADLDALSAAGLVRLGDKGWAPSHDLIADALAASLPPDERARIHEALAGVL